MRHLEIALFINPECDAPTGPTTPARQKAPVCGLELGPSGDEPLVWEMFEFWGVPEFCFCALVPLFPRVVEL